MTQISISELFTWKANTKNFNPKILRIFLFTDMQSKPLYPTNNICCKPSCFHHAKEKECIIGFRKSKMVKNKETIELL